MLQIHLGSITDAGLTMDEQVDSLTLPLLNAVSHEEGVRFIGPVHTRVHATLSGETVLIEGSVDTTVRLPCSRCLEPFASTLAIDFSVTAMPQLPSIADPQDPRDTELAAEDMNVIVYHGESVALDDEISQQIIMALPFKPLCRDTCMGLCGHCGANLNQGACQCRQQEQNNPFAILKTLSLPKKEE
jgi:uncharacterized protein